MTSTNAAMIDRTGRGARPVTDDDVRRALATFYAVESDATIVSHAEAMRRVLAADRAAQVPR